MFDVNGCEYVFRGTLSLVPAHNLASQCLGSYNTLNASDSVGLFGNQGHWNYRYSVVRLVSLVVFFVVILSIQLARSVKFHIHV